MSDKDFQNGLIVGMVSSGVVEVEDTTKLDNLETLIDESGVLDSTDGSATEKVEELIEKAENENLWYITSKSWTNKYQYLFQDSEITKLPIMSFENATYLGYIAPNSQLETVHYYIGSPTVYSYYYAFRNCKKLKFVYGLDVSGTTAFTHVFSGCVALETIQEPLNFTPSLDISFGGAFDNCYALVDIRFGEKCICKNISFYNSPLLSIESIKSIAYGLAYVTTAQTLTFNKVFENDFEKLPAELRDLITNQKGWTLAFA